MNAAKVAVRRRGFAEKLVDYMRRRFQQTPEEELEESTTLPPRYRPEPPDALARACRFTPHEIKLMYRGFKQECPTGMVDEESFKNIFSQFFPIGDATQYAHYVFNTVKHKQRGKLNFEMTEEVAPRKAKRRGRRSSSTQKTR
ncbi:PREDICTED: Kv channel-interacting protein 4-like [Papilio polytes]|uniref:Kv channel-interacting protein 4-like n=1 Tax=Papilio polytes TaxID=76194 RepID=UPI000675FA2D|nr:PREDICTED: Kv channel-interacting protein 4-like [Papilio polytes]